MENVVLEEIGLVASLSPSIIPVNLLHREFSWQTASWLMDQFNYVLLLAYHSDSLNKIRRFITEFRIQELGFLQMEYARTTVLTLNLL